MRRSLIFALSLILLFLCGCQKEPVDTTFHLTGDPETDPYQWAAFYYSPTLSPAEEVVIQLSGDTSLRWNGSEYSITDGNGTRSYRYLAYLTDISETDQGFHYLNEYVLTDTPGLSLEVFRKTRSGEVVYSDSVLCKSAAEFGDAPEAITDLMQRHLQTALISEYTQNTLFEREFFGDSLNDRQELLRRWDYSGTLLCEISVEGFAECFVELEDGGFLTTIHNYEHNTYQVICYNSDGSIRWDVRLGENDPPTLIQMIVRPDGIYGFGTIEQEDSFRDLYFCHISLDGELLNESILGGTDFDSMHWVEESDNGFSIYGSTQSSDGDFPLSEDGYGVEFLLDLAYGLNIQSVKAEEHDQYYLDTKGYLDGKAVFSGDEVLAPSHKDTLPTQNIGSFAVFEYENGYVILRNHIFGIYPYSNPVLCFQPSYRQMIATGYDAEGNPLWQTVSDPYVG